MSLQNEMRRTALTNLEHKAKRLRMEIESLTKTICINLDCGLKTPENLLIPETDSMWDDLKSKWAELIQSVSEIERLKAELN